MCRADRPLSNQASAVALTAPAGGTSVASGTAVTLARPPKPAYAAIDGVRAYGRALTSTEVTALFQAAR